jgi:tRNA(Ile)-lysidine synthase
LEHISNKKAPERGFFSFTFENRLERAIASCEITDKSIFVLAVSGGIDSMVMASAMTNILKNKKKYNTLSVVTINHNIREEKVTAEDAQLVLDYCQDVLHIPCIVKTVPRNYIEKLAIKRGRGMEEAARYERYRLLNAVVEELMSPANVFIFTAHQRNDLLETVLMRFLQGSSAVGPQSVRKEGGITYCKPLLEFSRDEIEHYASENTIPYREDSSNADIAYFRNRMRHQLIPFLNKIYPGWDGAVIRGDEKRYEQLAVIKMIAENLHWQCSRKEVTADFSVFKNAPNAARVQMLYDGLDKLNTKKRVAYSQLHLAAKNAENFNYLEKNGTEKKIFSNANDIEIGYYNKLIYIKKIPNRVAEYGFFAIINKTGTYSVDGGIIDVQNASLTTEKHNKDIEWTGTQTLPFSIKGIKQKSETTKITVEDLENRVNKKKSKVFVRFIRISLDE